MAASYHILLLVLALSADAGPSWYGFLCVRGAPLLFEEDVVSAMKANCVFVLARHNAYHRSSIGNIYFPPKGSKVNIACCACFEQAPPRKPMLEVGLFLDSLESGRTHFEAVSGISHPVGKGWL